MPHPAVALFKTVAVTAFLFLIVLAQLASDTARTKAKGLPSAASPALIRALDVGLHQAAAAFLWVGTRIQILYDPPRFVREIEVVNAVDPKFAAPYAFATLALPYAKQLENPVDLAIAIGEKGVRDADPDWRIPFYLGTLYQVERDDRANAVKYYDIASRSPDAPDYIRRFTSAYLISQKNREETKTVWQTIFDTAPDDFTRARAKLYLERIEVFGVLEKAAKAYKAKRGAYPKAPRDLVRAGVIPVAPPDPFGYELYFNEEGAVSLVKPSGE